MTDSHDATTDTDDRATDTDDRATDTDDRATDTDDRATDTDDRATDTDDRATDTDARATDTDARPNDTDDTTTHGDQPTDPTAAAATGDRPGHPLADGGATGADEVVLDPWGSDTIQDYRKLFEEFGIERFEEILPSIPEPFSLMRRGIVFGHRDYRPVAEAMKNDEPFAALSGFMPTGDPHIGHKLVFDEIIFHQRQGGDAYALIADLEAHSARGLEWDEIDEHARDYVLSLLAAGFDPDEGTLYRQATNREVQDLAFELGIEANFSELQSIYGFDGETDVSHMQSVVTQTADILYPQLDGPKPTVIPVGPDQDPHVRLTRDLAARVRYFGVTEAYASFETGDAERPLLAEAHRTLAERDPEATVRCHEAASYLEGERDPGPTAGEATTLDGLITMLNEAGTERLRPRVRFLDRNATETAFDRLVESIEGEKRVYDEHVDAFDLDRETAEQLARKVEVETGGYGFVPPSATYNRFMTGLTGGKMSSSVPESHISLLDDPGTGYEKVTAATTGGRETAEKQRELGGRAEECPVYELYAYLLAGEDDEFARDVYEECVGGDRLCGDCKEQAAVLMEGYLEDHQDKREEWAEKLDDLDYDVDSGRR